ncbi:MAG TPA: anhydro-N-acetylmuramic acid kinase [Terriglobales bacterium]|nr:anhydro-N-acetylmuramic acid kinase [Terriglobales bacterium]
MIVAGVMSGTSADGVDVALVRIDHRPGGVSHNLRIKLLAHAGYPYPKKVRAFALSVMNARRVSVADLARLNFLLGELYAEAVLSTEKRFRIKAQLVGCHGQTLYHQGDRAEFLGRKLAVTWQTGEGAIVARRLGIPAVSDFRPADMAAGGKGAPLVPFLDFLLYCDSRVGRIAQNIGGIANLTAIPPGASLQQVTAFDTGPGNMVIDAVTERLFHRPYDRDGKIAAGGVVLDEVLNKMLRSPFFRRKPPKTAGREEFGREFVNDFMRQCQGAKPADIVATATALTARSIRDAVRQFVLGGKDDYADFIVSGGGARNATLMARLGTELGPLGLRIRSSDEFGLPSEAKEAVAFAVLAYQTWNHLPANVPSATGARRPAILGKISYA